MLATQVDWPAARMAVAAAGPRLTSLLRSARRPDAPAVGDWDVTAVAAHISHAADAIWAMTKGGGNLIDDISGLSTLTNVLVAGEGRRPLPELADRIDTTVSGFLGAMEAAADDGGHSWLVRGTEMTLPNLTCHLLNELIVHGRDIAVAEGVPWPIDRTAAALVVEGFLFPSLHNVGSSLILPEAKGVRARMQIHVRGGGSACMRFYDGELTIEPTPLGPVDCHLSVDPAAFLLVAWGRIGQWPAILRGQLLAWGRKPWLGLRMRGWLRSP